MPAPRAPAMGKRQTRFETPAPESNMMMSKRHFVALASTLRNHRASREMVEAIAATLAQTNSHFQRDQFIRAAMAAVG